MKQAIFHVYISPVSYCSAMFRIAAVYIQVLDWARGMPEKTSTARRATVANADASSSTSIAREFFVEQLPLIAGVLCLGLFVAWWQYGFVPNGDRAFPVAGVRVPVWHLLWMGLWTGYIATLVGQAPGIFALPYSTSVLRFDNPHISSTMLVLTFLSPLAALLGFRRSGQWNLDFALSVCAGGVLGGLIGPFFRATVLANADTFRLTLGVALALLGLQLCWKAIRDYSRFGKTVGHSFMEAGENGERAKFKITTVERGFLATRIRFGGHERVLPNLPLFCIGALIGAFSSALGVGGGFLLVPIMAMAYNLPLYVMVAATIPYTIVLSVAGILTFTLILPWFGTLSIGPEWSWGFFTAAGGLLGSWWASKTQLYVPEHLLNWLLGVLIGLMGLLYCLSFVVELPFKL